MHYRIQFAGTLGGLAYNAARKGEKASVVSRQFLSSEDGAEFINALDELGGLVLAHLAKSGVAIAPSAIQTMLVVIGKDKQADVYINYPSLTLTVKARKTIQVGQLVSRDDIADIDSLLLGDNVAIPQDSGVIFLFSVGWRKGFFFDFTPLISEGPSRQVDLGRTFGAFYSYLMYQDLIRCSDSEWGALFRQHWFLFVGLSVETRRKMLNCVRNGWLVDEYLDEIHNHVTRELHSMTERWTDNEHFKLQLSFITTAIERYRAGDYISVVSILFPRIEGIMRAFSAKLQPRQRELAKSIVETSLSDGERYSPLFPARFEKYLADFYFKQFRPNENAEISRNSIAHGVASADKYDLKAATISLLILDQISFFTTPRAEPK